MLRTLFLIPHEIAGIPIFGVGWLLLLLIIVAIVRLAYAMRFGQSLSAIVSHEGIMWAGIAATIVFVLPRVELLNLDGEPIGMAVRGYGAMLVAAVMSAVALATIRTKNRGIDPDVIYAMAPWVFISGMIGARLFFVIQYREQFIGDTTIQTLGNMLAFTNGGLVVYGSFIGGVLAGIIYLRKHKLPVLRIGDAIVPCMFLGVFLGRIGCLMNGCCYGGRCDESWSALHFPRGSAVYQEQLTSGELLGLKVNPQSMRIDDVADGSLAEEAGIERGKEFKGVRVDLTPLETAPRDIPAEDALVGTIAMVNGKTFRWSPAELPDRALPVYPAQLISSGSSLLLCLLLCSLSLVFRRDGAVMMLGFAGYAVMRFVLEMIRVDELGQFGTQFSISQWVSLIVLLGAIGGLAWIYHRPEPEYAQNDDSSTNGVAG